jgi:hypothetical protein
MFGRRRSRLDKARRQLNKKRKGFRRRSLPERMVSAGQEIFKA